MDLSLVVYPYNTSNESCIASDIVSNLLNGDFHANLNGPLCKELLSVTSHEDSYEVTLKSNIEKKLNCDEDIIRHYEVLCIGISSLQLFVQVNWTGPPDISKYQPPLTCLRESLAEGKNCTESQWKDHLTAALVLDGEGISANIHNLELLLLARAVLNASSFEGLVSGKWWRMRCLYIHQQVLEERSPTIYNHLSTLIDELSGNEVVATTSTLYSLLHLEAASVWLHYSNVGKADQLIKAAHKSLGLDINLIGALGKRTKYQEKELAQLTLSVNLNKEEQPNESLLPLVVVEPSHLPKDVKLDDDVRLSQIAFSDLSMSQFPRLQPVEQAAVLASCIYKKKSQPKDKLHSEEIAPYITCLTSQPQVWALQMSALLQRSKLESDHRRTIERAMMQFQSLTDSICESEPTVTTRQDWLYCSHLPPAWRLQALLAHSYLSLGMVQTALDEFLKLQLWEEVIACYNYLKLRHKAAEIIRQELERQPSVKLLCLLGDATDDVDCYRSAWEMSGEKSGRAQRHWAMYYFTRKQYAESISHLEKSLSLNSLQDALWFRLGYAALIQEDWALCAKAYQRYVTLEPESFEAWNNLAKAYVKTGQKGRAFRALQEAVKCNYENWKVWDNLMAVSTDCGQFDEVIRCYHRILDLTDKHFVDVGVLEILTKVVVDGLYDTKECSAARLKKLTLTLFGRITSQILGDSTLWQLYAQIAASNEPSAETRTKVAQCLQKAYNAATQGSWERDVTNCEKVTDLCIDLAKAYVKCCSHCASSDEKVQMLSSAKLPLKSVLSKIEKEQTDLVTGEIPESLATKYKELLSHYEQIVDEIERLQSI